MTFKLKQPDSLVLKSTNNNNLEAINTPLPHTHTLTILTPLNPNKKILFKQGRKLS